MNVRRSVAGSASHTTAVSRARSAPKLSRVSSADGTTLRDRYVRGCRCGCGTADLRVRRIRSTQICADRHTHAMPRTRDGAGDLVSRGVAAEQPVDDEVRRPDDDRRPDVVPEPVDVEVGDDQRGQPEHQHRDEEPGDPERQDREREREELEDRLQDRVQDPEDERRPDDGRPLAVEGDTGEDPAREAEHDRVRHPRDEEPPDHPRDATPLRGAGPGTALVTEDGGWPMGLEPTTTRTTTGGSTN